MTQLATHLGAFLREYLPRDRRASPRTVESYAYAFQMLACFAADRLGVRPCNLVVEQLTAPLVLDFLDSLQRERGVPRHRQADPCDTGETGRSAPGRLSR